MRKVITKVNNNQFILTNKMKFDIYDVLEVMYQEAGSRKQEAGSRKQEAGSRKQDAARPNARLTIRAGLTCSVGRGRRKHDAKIIY